MKALHTIIVEDEIAAAKNLTLMLRDLAPHVEVIATLGSVQQSIEWLVSNSSPDLAFFDIQLEDGLSFEIFKKVNICFPVIFTTAFDQFAIQAFKVNSIDYLLKPIKESDLLFSLQKYENQSSPSEKQVFNKVTEALSRHRAITSFLIHVKDKLIPVPAKEIAWFSIENGLVKAHCFTRQVYMMEQTLDELESSLDERLFFRANRQFIINRSAIQDIEFYFNGRLLINLQPSSSENILISKARVPEFKSWMKQTN